MSAPKKKRLQGEIAIICEGETEQAYIRDITRGGTKIRVLNARGGGYERMRVLLPKYKNLYEVILVVCDLDRAFDDDGKVVEVKRLDRLITELQKIDKRNNIFLSYKNIEFWIACCIGISVSGNYEAELKNKGYEKGADVVKFLENHGGTYKQGVNCLQGQNESLFYFYKKEPTRKVFPKKQDVMHPQSTLWYFLDYIKLLQKG